VIGDDVSESLTENDLVPVSEPTPVPVAPVPPPAPVRRVVSAPVVPVAPVVASEPAVREKTFSQADLNEAIGKARTEARAAAYRYLGKELGVPVTAENGEIELSPLRTLVDEARSKRASNEDALRSTLDRLTEVEGRYSEKDSEVRGAINRAQQMLRRGEAKATAIQLGFSDPADAMALLGSLDRFPADLDTGVVTGLEEALRAIATSKPYLLRASDTPAPPLLSTPTPTPADSREAQRVDDDDRREGIRAQARNYF
jgi:hypothetical protein